MSLATFRKDITIEVYNPQGQKVLAYNVFRCWVSEYQALPQLDAGAQRGDDQHDQAGERGLGAGHLGDRAQGDVKVRRWTRQRSGFLAASGIAAGQAAPRVRADRADRPRRGAALAQLGRQEAASLVTRGAQPLRATARRRQPGARRGDPRAARGRPRLPAAAAAAGHLRGPDTGGLVLPVGRTAANGCRLTSPSTELPVESQPHRARLGRPCPRWHWPAPRTPATWAAARSPSGCRPAPTRRSFPACWPGTKRGP